LEHLVIKKSVQEDRVALWISLLTTVKRQIKPLILFMTGGIHHQYLSTPDMLGRGCCKYKSLFEFKGQLYRFMNQNYIKGYYIQRHSLLAHTQVAGGWGSIPSHLPSSYTGFQCEQR